MVVSSVFLGKVLENLKEEMVFVFLFLFFLVPSFDLTLISAGLTRKDLIKKIKSWNHFSTLRSGKSESGHLSTSSQPGTQYTWLVSLGISTFPGCREGKHQQHTWEQANTDDNSEKTGLSSYCFISNWSH